MIRRRDREGRPQRQISYEEHLVELYPLPIRSHSTVHDPVQVVLESLRPFDLSVVHLRYRAGQNLQRIADILSSTPEQVAAALMGVYRQTAAAVEA